MKLVSKIYMALIFLFLYAPIFVLIFFSFNASNSTSLFAGFSLRWYESLFQDKATLQALYNSLILAVASSLAATVLGTAAAVGIDTMRNKWLKSSVLSVTNIPMMNPEIVTGISMMLLFVFAGKLLGARDVLGFWTLLFAHITFNLPYVILSILPKLRQMDPHLSEAAGLYAGTLLLSGCFARHHARHRHWACHVLHDVARRFYHQLFYKRPVLPNAARANLLDDKAPCHAGYLCIVHPDFCRYPRAVDPV